MKNNTKRFLYNKDFQKSLMQPAPPTPETSEIELLQNEIRMVTNRIVKGNPKMREFYINKLDNLKKQLEKLK